MPALVAGIHERLSKLAKKTADGQDKPGHDIS
jgi:hypothetical protein